MPLDDIDLSDPSWSVFIDRICRGKATPFIGAAAAIPTLPSGTQLARDWAQRYEDYPGNQDDLTGIAQYLSDIEGPMAPKHLVLEALCDKGPPDFTAPNEPHALLAELPLPIYITTNYDDFMFQALRAKGKKPIREFCRWNPDVRKHGHQSVFDEPGFEPTRETPVVFHLHGILDSPESIVISEDDYLSFIVDLSAHRRQLLPARIQQALTGTSLMFMGYGLKDWNFKVIFQSLVIAMEAELRRESVSVQLCRDDQKEQNYLARYLENKSIEVFWGDLDEFVAGIRSRLEELQHPSTST